MLRFRRRVWEDEATTAEGIAVAESMTYERGAYVAVQHRGIMIYGHMPHEDTVKLRDALNEILEG